MFNFLYNPASLNFEVISMIVFFFTIYSLLGWLLENSYNYFTKREFFKPNFFIGPFKPMYGFAPVLLVALIGPAVHWAFVILLSFLIPTIIEYVTGILSQKFFQKQWWDYADMPLQLQGHICLPFSLCWGFLSLVCLKWLHSEVISLYEAAEPFWGWIWPAVLLYFIAEVVLAIRRHSSASLESAEPTI